MASLIQRGKIYYLQHYVGRRIKRYSLATASLQVAKEKPRQFESARHRGDDSPLPTRTPLPQILQAYLGSHPHLQDPQERLGGRPPPADGLRPRLPRSGGHHPPPLDLSLHQALRLVPKSLTLNTRARPTPS